MGRRAAHPMPPPVFARAAHRGRSASRTARLIFAKPAPAAHGLMVREGPFVGGPLALLRRAALLPLPRLASRAAEVILAVLPPGAAEG